MYVLMWVCVYPWRSLVTLGALLAHFSPALFYTELLTEPEPIYSS